jgi:proline racemase
LEVKQAANEEIGFIHPEKPYIKGIGGVRVNTMPPPSRTHAKEVVIWSEGLVDRSPCGTGCSAQLATSYAKGQLRIGEETDQESIIGTFFKARIVEETKVGNLKAVIPEISGTAYITGFNTLLIDPKDPLKDGFLLTAT